MRFLKFTLAVFLLVNVSVAFAATFELSAPKKALEGDMIMVKVSVNPQGDFVYTAKLSAKYSPEAELLKVLPASNEYIQLSDPEFQKHDTKNNTLVYAAGLPGGMKSKTDFAILTFKALREGKFVFEVTPESMILNPAHKNVFRATSSVTVVIYKNEKTKEQASSTPSTIKTDQEGALEKQDRKEKETKSTGVTNFSLRNTLLILSASFALLAFLFFVYGKVKAKR